MADPRVRDAFLRYLNAGLSVIPIGYKSKRPAFGLLPTNPATGKLTFLPYIKKHATLAEIEKWVAAGAYPGILAGPTSKNTIQYDFDDATFCEWLLANPTALDFLKKTWVVRTGSGKIHVYLRDDGKHPKPPGQIMLGKRKLGDVRVHGNYVVAPPALHEDTGEPYATLFGSPETILEVEDTYQTILRLVALLEAPEEAQSQANRPPAGPCVITPPPKDPRVKVELLKKLSHEKGIPAKIKRAIREGVIPGEGEWIERDRSKISSDIVAALMDAGWSFGMIDLTLAILPIGSLVYRNASRQGSYGQAWLRHVWREKTQLFEARKSAVLVAQGTNFKLISGECEIWPDGRVWTLIIEGPVPGSRDRLVAKESDIRTYAGWVSCVLNYLGFCPLMQQGHIGQGNHHLFITAVVNTCGASKPPEDATAPGRLRGAIVDLSRTDIWAGIPPRRSVWSLGWQDDHYTYLLPSMLSSRLSTSLGKNAPGDRDVTEAMSQLGAVWVRARYGEKMDQTEEMWRLSLHKPEEPHQNGTS